MNLVNSPPPWVIQKLKAQGSAKISHRGWKHRWSQLLKNRKTTQNLQLLESGRFLLERSPKSLGVLFSFLPNLPKVGNLLSWCPGLQRAEGMSHLSLEWVVPPRGAQGRLRRGWEIFLLWPSVYCTQALETCVCVVCVCVCVWERERETETERDRERERAENNVWMPVHNLSDQL